MAVLISLSGLPGVGKTTVARALSQATGAMHLRVDSIETSLKVGPLKAEKIDAAGYLIAIAVAQDNLRLGHNVIADTVNPIDLSREMWRDAADAVSATLLDVELICSDPAEHRRRVESRGADIPGHKIPNWEDVIAREYHPWDKDVFRVDTALHDATDCADQIAAAVHALKVS